MRKLIVDEWVSVDGFAARPDGAIDFFVDGQYAARIDHDMKALLSDVDTILLGANTYRLFREYWPARTVSDDPMADVINSTPKLVFSNTLREAPWGEWPPARLMAGDLERQVRELKKLPGRNLILWGSLSIAAALLKAGLIDRLIVRVCPVAIGRGQGFFPRDVSTLPLKLIDSRRHESGALMNEYVPD